MLLGAAMLGMAAGEEEGLVAVVRKLQKISKVTELNNTVENHFFLFLSLAATIVYLYPFPFQYSATILISHSGSRYCVQP